jgi:hypothetical protein
MGIFLDPHPNSQTATPNTAAFCLSPPSSIDHILSSSFDLANATFSLVDAALAAP